VCPGCGKKHGGNKGQGQNPGNPGGQNNPNGGPQQGQGNREIGELKGDEKFKATRIRGRVGKGKIVGSYFTRGAQVKGESEAEYTEVMRANATKSAEALDKTRIPSGMREYVKQYIDSITPERQ